MIRDDERYPRGYICSNCGSKAFEDICCMECGKSALQSQADFEAETEEQLNSEEGRKYETSS